MQDSKDEPQVAIRYPSLFVKNNPTHIKLELFPFAPTPWVPIVEPVSF
jgi:hypothetical protein